MYRPRLRRARAWTLTIAGPLLACAGEPETPAVLHTIDPSAVVAFQADASLQQIQDVASTPSGDVWAIQRVTSPHVFVFSAEGRLVDSFGTTGPAQAQILNPFWLVPTGDATRPMAVWDAGNRKVVTYDQNGSLAGVHAVQRSRGNIYAGIEEHSYGHPLKMERWGDGYVLEDHPDGLSVTGDYLRSVLVKLDAQGGIAERFMEFDREFRSGLTALGGDANLLVPIPLWSTCPSGDLAVFDPFASRVLWYAADGSAGDVDSVPLPTVAITEADQRAYLQREFELRWQEQREGAPDPSIIEASIDNFLERHWDRFPESAPRAVGMLCGPDRQVWLQQFSTAADPLGYAKSWAVHRPGQVDRVRVEFPDGFRPMEIQRERALGVLTSAEGVTTVAHVALPAELNAPQQAGQ